MALTATTTGAAFINMGVFSPIVALGIACLKAVLVILFFMHIRYQLESDDADGRRWLLHLSGTDHHDPV